MARLMRQFVFDQFGLIDKPSVEQLEGALQRMQMNTRQDQAERIWSEPSGFAVLAVPIDDKGNAKDSYFGDVTTSQVIRFISYYRACDLWNAYCFVMEVDALRVEVRDVSFYLVFCYTSNWDNIIIGYCGDLEQAKNKGMAYLTNKMLQGHYKAVDELEWEMLKVGEVVIDDHWVLQHPEVKVEVCRHAIDGAVTVPYSSIRFLS